MHPKSKSDLFWSFSWLALQGFGGVLAVVQRVLVEKKQWLTRQEFIEDWAVAQVLPGPNVVNLSLMLGDRHFGLPGAMAALAGILLFPMLIVLAMVVAFSGVADLPQVQNAMRGVGAVTAGLIAATGLKLMPALRHSPMSLGTCIQFAALTFVAIALLRLPLLWVLATVGVASAVWTYKALQRIEALKTQGAQEPQA
jgi:chromate transporter